MEKKWFVIEKCEVRVRKGEREGWIEMYLKKENGEVVKMICKRVGRFWSERSEESEEVI